VFLYTIHYKQEKIISVPTFNWNVYIQYSHMPTSMHNPAILQQLAKELPRDTVEARGAKQPKGLDKLPLR
jgi:hypothetical protein